MAKNTDTETAAVEAKSRNKIIAGESFTFVDRYSEGHVVTAAEASALNQLVSENIGNNLRETVKKAVEEAGEAGLSDEKRAELQAEISKYAAEYVFAAGGNRRSTDPVEREARSIAESIVHAQIAKLGTSVAAYKRDNADKYDAAIETMMGKEAVIAEAQDIVKRRTALASDLDLG